MNQDLAPPKDTGAQNTERDASITRPLFLKVAIVIAILLGVNIVIAWILEFYFKEPVNVFMSFVGNDASWTPTDTHFHAALGVHYFGDFQQYVGFAKSAFPPYSVPNALQAAYGPLAIVFVKVINRIFGWPIETFVYLLSSLSLFFYGIVRILGRGLESVLVALLLLASAPIIAVLDRGNFQLLVTGLCALFCIGVLKNRPMLIVIPLSLAISIKAYTAVLLVILIKNRKWRELAAVCGATVVMYTVGFLLVPGAILRNIHGFVHANVYFGQAGKDFVIYAVSVTGLIYKFFMLITGPTNAYRIYNEIPGWAVQIPTLVIFATAIFIVSISRTRIELQLITILAMMQLSPIGAFPYLQLNIIVELCLLLRLHRDTEFNALVDRFNRNLLLLTTFALVFGAAPWTFRFGSLPTSPAVASQSAAWVVIGPVAQLLCLTCVSIVIFRERSRPIEKVNIADQKYEWAAEK